MKTVAQAFQKFIEDLELREGEAREAKRQERVVAEAMKGRLTPLRTILSGSYGRGTAIRPLHDIDLFFILPAASGERSKNPEETLKRVQAALEAQFPGKKARLQNRSVNIEFSGTGIGFDVVPAEEDPGQPGQYWIPDRLQKGWIRSNPSRHEQLCNEANARAGTKLKPFIKMLKRWNVLQGKPVPSFLLEVMAYEGVATLPRGVSFSEGMTHLFEFISQHIQKPWVDPAGLGPPVNAGVSPGYLQQGQQRAAEALRKARRALELERRGDEGSAIDLWRELLGPDFPRR